MYKHLIVSGCSFTLWIYKTWADYTSEYLGSELIQQAHPGAGNWYIRRSITDYILDNDIYGPETLVMVMWSGLSRYELEVGRSFVDLSQDFMTNTKQINNRFFVESGGMEGGWKDNPYTRGYFNSLYKLTDKKVYLNNTIDNIVMLKSFLEVRNIPYYFMSHCDIFNTESEWAQDDYSAKGCDESFDKDSILDDKWIFANGTHSLHTFAKNLNAFSEDGYHPNTEAHEQFFKQAILPRLQ